MKKILCIAALAILCGTSKPAFAQESASDIMKIGVGGSFAKPKIVPRLEKFGIGQVTITYKLNSTENTATREKGSGKIAGAKLTAYLEPSDGELTNDDFQEITDHFYHYFQQALKKGGIDTVAWSTIVATDFYKDAEEKTMSNEEEKGSGQVWQTYNANKGNILYAGLTGFAFGKIKKASRFCSDIDAPVGFFYLTVDFADIDVNVSIHSSESGYAPGFYPYTTSRTTTKYHAATKPVMKVIPGDRNTMLWNEKSQSETITLQHSLESDATYHTAVTQDPSRLKNNLFAFAKSMNPVVIETTRDKYKNAAKKALEKYADTFVALAKELKKD